MKISKKIFAICLFIVLLIIGLTSLVSYRIGQFSIPLTVKEVIPLQLAQAMQNDNFYSEYSKNILLIDGKVKDITSKNSDTIVQFQTTNAPSVLGKVSCDMGNNQTHIKNSDTIRVLTVAYDAKRQKVADVFMPNCYLLK